MENSPVNFVDPLGLEKTGWKGLRDLLGPSQRGLAATFKVLNLPKELLTPIHFGLFDANRGVTLPFTGHRYEVIQRFGNALSSVQGLGLLLSGYNIAIPAISMTSEGRLTQGQAWTMIAVRTGETLVNARFTAAAVGAGIAAGTPGGLPGQVALAVSLGVTVGTATAAATRATGNAILDSLGIPIE